MNKYPAWKYIVIAVTLVVAFLYTLPNFYGTVPALQVAGLRAVKADATTLKSVEDALKDAKIAADSVQLDGEIVKVKFKDTGTQLQARDAIQARPG